MKLVEIPNVKVTGNLIDGVEFEPTPATLSSKGAMRMIVVPTEVVKTFVWRDPELEDAEYPHYGIHLLCDDGLIFVTKGEKPIVVDMWDCREGSPTAGNNMVVEISKIDPRLKLRILRGVAHLPMNLQNVNTLNCQEAYYDTRTLPVPQGGDVINIRAGDVAKLRSTRLPVARYKVPRIFQSFYLNWMVQNLPTNFPWFYQD